MNYKQMSNMALEDLILHAYRTNNLAAQECAMSRIDEAVANWGGLGDMARMAFKKLCDRFECPRPVLEMEFAA